MDIILTSQPQLYLRPKALLNPGTYTDDNHIG